VTKSRKGKIENNYINEKIETLKREQKLVVTTQNNPMFSGQIKKGKKKTSDLKNKNR